MTADEAQGAGGASAARVDGGANGLSELRGSVVRAATHDGPARDPASVARADATGREAYAGLVSRLLALGMDTVLLAAAVSLVGAGAPALWGVVVGHAPHWLRVCCGVLAGLTPFTYFWLCWCTSGRTVGGLLLGTAVRRPDGSRVRAVRAAARAVLGLAFAPLALGGMLLTVGDPHRRALHDLLLGTVVHRT
jgi:uncharacterized RDD family membrane protein YckC